MSDVCGIFQKPCPQCAAAVAKTAARCHCGYSFDADVSSSEIAQSWAEEKLYEDYLNARVTQTAQAAIEAQGVQRARHDDPRATAAAIAALEEAEAARRDLSAQSARVEELRQAMVAEAGTVMQAAAATSTAEPMPVSTSISAPVTATIESPQVMIAPVSARAAEVARAAEALRAELAKLRHDSGKPAGAVQLIKGTQHARASAALAQPKAAELAKKTCTQCQAAVLASAKRCRCGFSFVTEEPSAEPAHAPKIQEVLARAEDIKKSRRESAQAEKAERIRQARLARAAERAKTTTSVSTTATVVKSATLESIAPGVRAIGESATVKSPVSRTSAKAAVLAEPASMSADRVPMSTATATPAPNDETSISNVSPAPLRAHSPAPATAKASSSIQHLSVCLAPARPIATLNARDTKECPNCTANVAATAIRCKCGFEFRSANSGSPMPALSLDASELIKVRDLYMQR